MEDQASVAQFPTLQIAGAWSWDSVLSSSQLSGFSAALAKAIASRRWFGSKTQAIQTLEVLDLISLSPTARIVLARLNYSEGAPEVYCIPLGFARELPSGLPPSAGMVRLESAAGENAGVLYDAMSDAVLGARWLELFDTEQTLIGAQGELTAARIGPFVALRGDAEQTLTATPVRSEQSNSSVLYGDRLILKIFRKVETGTNPDCEISAYLTKKQFAHSPPLAGTLEYRQAGEEPWTLGMLQALVVNHGDAWQYTLKDLTGFMLAGVERETPAVPRLGLCLAAQQPVPPEARAAFSEFITRFELLGRRTAEMHLALASDPEHPRFAPQWFNSNDQHAFVKLARENAHKTLELLRQQQPYLPAETQPAVNRVLQLEPAIAEHYERLTRTPVSVAKIRCHGDYHLGQVLVTEDDFVIIDFEGEPARSLAERQARQLALRDVAGMVRSLHYASCAAAHAAAQQPGADRTNIHAVAQSWYAWCSTAFLAEYLRTVGRAPFVPENRTQLEEWFEGCLLQKAVYELRYELNNRPDWAYLPLAALLELVGER